MRPRRASRRHVDDPGRAGGVERALAGAGDEAGDDQPGEAEAGQVEQPADGEDQGAEQHRRLAAAAVGEPAGEGAQQQAGDRVGADHDPDRDVARVERAVHVAGQHRQHRADREQPAEGDREERREAAAELAAAGAPAALTAAARRGSRPRGRAPARPPRPAPRSLVPLRTRIVASPALRPPAMSEETRSPIIATRSAPPIAASAISKRWCSGLPPISATRPEAVSTAARIEPVPGHSPPGIGIVGSWLVRDQRRAAVERPLRGQQLGVVEAAVPGDDDDRRPARAASPVSTSRRRPRPSPSAPLRRSRRRRRRSPPRRPAAP